MKIFVLTAKIVGLVIFLISCSIFSGDKSFHSKTASIAIIPADGVIPKRVELKQAWNPKTRMDFWFTSQGSQIIPYSWFTWLEQANSKVLFRNAQHMDKLRYLPMASSKENPSGLPIGFSLAESKKDKEAWVGLTCAACHTNQLDYNETSMLIEGAPTLANFILFFSSILFLKNLYPVAVWIGNNGHSLATSIVCYNTAIKICIFSI